VYGRLSPGDVGRRLGQAPLGSPEDEELGPPVTVASSASRRCTNACGEGNEVIEMLLAKNLGGLLKLAEKGKRTKRSLKRTVARGILKERRLVCLVVGCSNRDNYLPCSRCGAREPVTTM
jgi:hypothetical protein